MTKAKLKLDTLKMLSFNLRGQGLLEVFAISESAYRANKKQI